MLQPSTFWLDVGYASPPSLLSTVSRGIKTVLSRVYAMLFIKPVHNISEADVTCEIISVENFISSNLLIFRHLILLFFPDKAFLLYNFLASSFFNMTIYIHSRAKKVTRIHAQKNRVSRSSIHLGFMHSFTLWYLT